MNRIELERRALYGRVQASLHQKYYKRFDLLLKVLGVLGLSSPLLGLMGGEASHAWIEAAVFFVVIQAIDWKVTPGELAGSYRALAREFLRVERRMPNLSDQELHDALHDAYDNDLTDIEPVKKVAYVRAAHEGGYFDELPEIQRHLGFLGMVLDRVFI